MYGSQSIFHMWFNTNSKNSINFRTLTYDAKLKNKKIKLLQQMKRPRKKNFIS